MLHLAIRIKTKAIDYQNYQVLATYTNNEGVGAEDILAATSDTILRERVAARINKFPEERWLILQGNVVAETSAPPVNFRTW